MTDLSSKVERAKHHAAESLRGSDDLLGDIVADAGVIGRSINNRPVADELHLKHSFSKWDTVISVSYDEFKVADEATIADYIVQVAQQRRDDGVLFPLGSEGKLQRSLIHAFNRFKSEDEDVPTGVTIDNSMSGESDDSDFIIVRYNEWVWSMTGAEVNTKDEVQLAIELHRFLRAAGVWDAQQKQSPPE